MDQRERIYGFVDGAVAPSLDGSYAPQLPINFSTLRGVIASLGICSGGSDPFPS